MTQTLGKTMKAVAIDRFGGVETLKTQELPIPAVGDDEVLVHVEALASAFGIPLNGKADLRKSSISSPCFRLYWDLTAPALLKPWDPK